MTGSSSFNQALASMPPTNLGWSIGGMPSRGGPPDSSSASGTPALEKLVFQPRVAKCKPESVTAVGSADGVGVAAAVGAVVMGATDVADGTRVCAADGA